jgi:hypothetical protein
MVLNTALDEELLFRGLLLPRMRGAFVLAWPSRRYGSALMGIIVHSSQTVLLGIAVLVVATG